MKTSTKWFIGLAVLAVVATPIIGPFTFYPTVVPYLTPILPKPEGLPIDAEARHNWKGPGLYWAWEPALPLGCARWTLAEERWISVRFRKGGGKCEAAEPQFGFANYRDDYADFSRAGSGGVHCSVHTANLTPSEAAEARGFLVASLPEAKGEAERRLLDLSIAWLEQPEPEPDEHPCGDRYPDPPK